MTESPTLSNLHHAIQEHVDATDEGTVLHWFVGYTTVTADTDDLDASTYKTTYVTGPGAPASSLGTGSMALARAEYDLSGDED